MTRTFAVAGLLIIGIGSVGVAQQRPAAASPATQCRTKGQTYQNEKIRDARDSNKTPDVRAIIEASKVVTRACLNLLPLTGAEPSELASMSSAYMSIGDTVK